MHFIYKWLKKCRFLGRYFATVETELEVFATLAEQQVKDVHAKLTKLHPKEMAAILSALPTQ